jgi:hypothetical protein
MEKTITIDRIDLSKELFNIEKELEDINNGQYIWQFDIKSIKKNLLSYIRNFDFYDVDYVFNYGSMWCGCLTAEPWCELNKSEETVLNVLLHDHTEVVTEPTIEIRFRENKQSILNEFLEKYLSDEDYVDNINASFNSMLYVFRRKLVEHLHDCVSEDLWRNQWGEWREHWLCPKCQYETYLSWYNNGRCPGCNTLFWETEKWI